MRGVVATPSDPRSATVWCVGALAMALIRQGEPLATCSATPAFITAVNVGGVGLAGLSSLLYARSRPSVGAAFYGTIAVNAAVHIAGAVGTGRYNPGLLTAAIFFVPAAVGALRAARSEPRAGSSARVLALGVAVHVALIAGLRAYSRRWISHAALCSFQVLMGLLGFVR